MEHDKKEKILNGGGRLDRMNLRDMHTVTEIEVKRSTIRRSNQGFQTLSDFK